MALRVLHIFAPNYKYRFGGPTIEWQQIFKNWNDSNVQHLVLDHEEKVILDANLAFDFELSSSQFTSPKAMRAKWVFDLLNDLNRYKSRYDIIHFHILWWAGLLSILWARLHGIPTIYQSVLLNEDTPTGIINQQLGKIKLFLLKKTSLILALTEPLRLDYLSFGFQEQQVITLMNSVDTKLFHSAASLDEKMELREKYNLPQDSRILIFAGSLIHRKGVDLLVDAFIQAAQNNPDLFLLLVGPKNIKENPSIDAEFNRTFTQTIENKGLIDRVRFWGLEKDRDVLSGLFRASDVFVFPSRNEGLGYVILEAMASGLPVIVSDLPVLKNIVCNLENALVVPCEDVSSIESAITTLIAHPALANKLAKNARDYVINNHQFNRWQEILGIAYLNVLQKVKKLNTIQPKVLTLL